MRIALLLAGLLLLTACAASRPSTEHDATVKLPIQSRAELQRYLAHTPLEQSPLGRLSPGARARFLTQLHFGPSKLVGFNAAAPASQLTHDQIVPLFSLFGAEEYAAGFGLTPAEQARRQQERRSAARARGCASVANCPLSEIETRYNQFVLHERDRSLTQAARAANFSHRYQVLFAKWQNRESLAVLSHPDLRLLKRAAEHATFWAPSTQHIRDLKMDLAEMQRRGMARDADYADLYHAYVANRRFRKATALLAQHPAIDVPPLPEWHPAPDLPAGQPTALSLSADGQRMSRRAFDLDQPLQIVVVASCHFSKDAARAIASRPELKQLFVRHAIWLADQGESIAAARDWNREFPDQPIHIAWANREWQRLDDWSMPTFYVFRHGELVQQWSSWPPESGMTRLRRNLQQAGVLPTAGN